jgi:site-specific DNA-cytosine methylase
MSVTVLLQIGNAVPPPMGAAIGFEIRKCISAAEKSQAESKMEIP